MVGASNPKIAQCELTHDKQLLDKRTKSERIVTRPAYIPSRSYHFMSVGHVRSHFSEVDRSGSNVASAIVCDLKGAFREQPPRRSESSGSSFSSDA
jgi:hypothetical protein